MSGQARLKWISTLIQHPQRVRCARAKVWWGWGWGGQTARTGGSGCKLGLCRHRHGHLRVRQGAGAGCAFARWIPAYGSGLTGGRRAAARVGHAHGGGGRHVSLRGSGLAELWWAGGEEGPGRDQGGAGTGHGGQVVPVTKRAAGVEGKGRPQGSAASKSSGAREHMRVTMPHSAVRVIPYELATPRLSPNAPCSSPSPSSAAGLRDQALHQRHPRGGQRRGGGHHARQPVPHKR